MRDEIIIIAKAFQKINSIDKLYRSLFNISTELTFLFAHERILVKNRNTKKIESNISEMIDSEDVELFKRSVSKLIDSPLKNFCKEYKLSHYFLLIVDRKRQIFVGMQETVYLGLRQSHRFELFLHKLKSTYQRINLLSELAKHQKENRLLFEIGRKITSSLNLHEVLNSILDGLKELIDYDAAGIFLKTGKKNSIEQIIHRGYDEMKLDVLKKKNSIGLISWVLKHKVPIVISDTYLDKRYFTARENTRSQVTVPMFNGNKIIGTFTLEKNEKDYYTQDIIPSLQTMAEQAAIAIINAHLYSESLHKKKLEADLINAANIQSALVPKRAPKIKGIDLSLYSKASQYLGGDIHDFIRLSDSSLIFSLGDVSGKGAPASILMAVLFAGLRSQISRNYQICEHVAHLNNLLSISTNTSSFATYFLAQFDNAKRTLTYVNAGHTPPVLIRKNGDLNSLSKGGMVIGFLENEQFEQDMISVERNDVFLAFTDGLDEAFDHNEEEFGVERIINIVKENRQKTATQIKNLLVEHVKSYRGEEFEDDVTIIIAKF